MQNDDGFSIDLSSLENNNIVDEQAEADAEEPDASLLVQNPNAEYELDLEAVLEDRHVAVVETDALSSPDAAACSFCDALSSVDGSGFS